MRKSLAAFSAAAAVAALCVAPGAVGASAPANNNATINAAGLDKTDNTRFIVGYEELATTSSAAATTKRADIASKFGVEIQAERQMSTGGAVIQLDEGLDQAEAEAFIKELAAQPGVSYVEPDIKMYPTWTPSDRYFQNQWHYHGTAVGINAPKAWDTTKGKGATVAVLDTGITPHPDLRANVAGGYDFISDSWAAGDGNGRDNDPLDNGDWIAAGTCGNPQFESSSWHGTHVAGTIAASKNDGGVVGVAPDATIVPVRVLGKCGGYTSDITDAIVWASGGSVSGVPRNAHKADVINMSLGGASRTCPASYQRAIDTAVNNGTTVVVAAGNDAVNAANATPANCRNVVTVGATDKNGNQSYYSNYGRVVDVSAPGGDTRSSGGGVLSTVNTGKTTPDKPGYAYYQGTSMATPHVAGIAALVKAANPNLSADEVANILTTSVKRIPGRCWGGACGAGLIDASLAVNNAKKNGSGGGYWWGWGE